jgi:hypothetical protein
MSDAQFRPQREHWSSMLRRGFMPSVGAGSSLVAAAIVAVIAFTGVVAFHGWPRAQARADGPAATLAPATRADDGRSVARPARLAAAASAGVVATPARRASRVRPNRSPGSGRSPVGTPVAARGGDTTPSRPAPSTPSAPAQPVATSPAPAAAPAQQQPAPSGNPVPSLPSVPAPSVPQRPVGTVVETVRHVVPPVPAPAPLQPVVGTVNQTVDGAAATVDGVVGGLLKPR